MTNTTNLEIISSYALQDAIDDGMLAEVFKSRWGELTGGKPLVATAHIMAAFSLAALLEIWNAYVEWRTQVMPTLPEEAQLFSTMMNGQKVWVLEDGDAFAIMFPEDY